MRCTGNCTLHKKVNIPDLIILFLNSLPNDKIFGFSKSKEIADDKIKVTENLKFVLWKVKNFVGKGKNTGYQHFTLFPQCFLKTSFSGSSKVGQPITTQSLLLTTLRRKPLEKNVGKGENAGYQYFLLSPQCFLPFTKQISNFQSYLFVACKCFPFGQT